MTKKKSKLGVGNFSPEILNWLTDINPGLGEFEVELFDGVQDFFHVFEGLSTSLGGLAKSVPLIAGRLAFSINSLRCDSIQVDLLSIVYLKFQLQGGGSRYSPLLSVVPYFSENFPLYLVDPFSKMLIQKNFSYPRQTEK